MDDGADAKWAHSARAPVAPNNTPVDVPGGRRRSSVAGARATRVTMSPLESRRSHKIDEQDLVRPTTTFTSKLGVKANLQRRDRKVLQLSGEHEEPPTQRKRRLRLPSAHRLPPLQMRQSAAAHVDTCSFSDPFSEPTEALEA